MGWPMREIPRRVFIAHHNGIACAIGRGLEDRAEKTRAFALQSLNRSASAGRRLPNFRALSIGIHDGHCNEVM